MSVQQADLKVDASRAKVQEWGATMNAGTFDWHPLGHALQLAHEAIEAEYQYQRPWTLLADIYHRIGKPDLAKRCLARSYELATPGPNHPGRFYASVAENIRTGYPYGAAGGVPRQEMPAWFERKYQRYWVIDQKLISKSSDFRPENLPTLFLSYAHEDRDAATRLCEDLSANGIAVWMDTQSLSPGVPWESITQEAIRAKDFVLVCLSAASVAKTGYFQVEIKAALYWQGYRPEGKVFLIPVRLDDCDVPAELRRYQYVDLFGENWSEGVRAITRSVVALHLRVQP